MTCDWGKQGIEVRSDGNALNLLSLGFQDLQSTSSASIRSDLSTCELLSGPRHLLEWILGLEERDRLPASMVRGKVMHLKHNHVSWKTASEEIG